MLKQAAASGGADAAAERPPGTASSAHSKTSRALRPKTQPQEGEREARMVRRA